MAAAGLLGAAVGFVGGLYLGSELENAYFPCGCDDPGLAGALFGATAGSALVVPITVHLANGRRGSFKRTLGASASVGAIGLLGMLASIRSEAGLLFLFGAPIAEVAVSVISEQRSSAER
jgi:hypothetical protein